MPNTKTTLALAVLCASLALSACQPKKTEKSVEETTTVASQPVEEVRPSLQGVTEKVQLDLPACKGKICPELSVERLQSNQPALDQLIDQAILAELSAMLSFVDQAKKPQLKSTGQSTNNKVDQQATSTVIITPTPLQLLTDQLLPFRNTFLAIDQDLKTKGVSHKISLNISPRILNTEAPIATVVLNSSSYMGGAHGTSAQHYFNFDLDREKPVKLSDLLEDNQRSALEKLVYQQFKTWVLDSELASNVVEYEQVWKFTLTDNFYLGKNGLILQYGEYEIGPYAVGLPRFEIPYDQLNGIVKTEYLPKVSNVEQAASGSAQVNTVAKP